MLSTSLQRDNTGGAPTDAEQRTLNRDSAAAERDRAAKDRDDKAADRDRAQAQADQRTVSCDHAATRRDRSASDRDVTAAFRDESQASDHRISHPHEAATDLECPIVDGEQFRVDLDQRTSDRHQAAADRSLAAADREAAAADRLAATHHREQLHAELRRAQFDQLTGAFGLELGIVRLESEINRARRGTGHLVLAYVDVDGLKEVNDRQGHAAGDALLRDMVGAIHRHLRSYDLVVRVGGDEFVCALGDSLPDDGHRRFQEIRATLKQMQPHASFTVGFVALGDHESLDQLKQRGDAALYEAKHNRPSPPG
jgi:diguanylate cyclase (GGDEF)-like protein